MARNIPGILGRSERRNTSGNNPMKSTAYCSSWNGIAPAASSKHLKASTAVLRAALRDACEAALSPNTQRAYRSQFARFQAWCSDHGLQSLPAPSDTVAAHLVARVALEGRSMATAELALAAIAAAHRAAGFSFDTQSPQIELAMRGLRRKFARVQRQARPLSPALVRAIASTSGDADLRCLRDAAVIALSFAAGLRRSELAGLDYQRPGSGHGALAISAQAIRIVLVTSKTRVPVEVAIPIDQNKRLANVLRRWIKGAGISSGDPLFLSISRTGCLRRRLAPASVNLIIKHGVARHLIKRGLDLETAYAEAETYSGHSGRVGLYVASAEAGVPVETIARLARHASLNVAQRYVRAADLLRDSPSKLPAVAI